VLIVKYLHYSQAGLHHLKLLITCSKILQVIKNCMEGPKSRLAYSKADSYLLYETVGLVGGEKLVLTSQVHKDTVLNRKW